MYSPYDYAVHEDPYPVYARLREEAPLYRNEELDFWALSRHGAVSAAFRDTSTYSNGYGVSLEPTVWGPKAHRTMSFLAMDPPRHTRMRALVSRGFTPLLVGSANRDGQVFADPDRYDLGRDTSELISFGRGGLDHQADLQCGRWAGDPVVNGATWTQPRLCDLRINEGVLH